MLENAKKLAIALISIAALALMLSITAHSMQSAAKIVLLGLFYIFTPGWVVVNMLLREALLIEKITASIALGIIILTLASSYASLFGIKLSAMMMAVLIISIIIIGACKAFHEHKKDSKKHGR